MSYDNRQAPPRAPSSGAVSRPIHGAGRLEPGWHALEILTANETRSGRWLWLAQNPAGHCHSEVVQWIPPWARELHLRVRGRVAPAPGGYVLSRDVGRYRARLIAPDGSAGAWVSDWNDDPAALYAALTAQNLFPATTRLVEVKHADSVWVPIPVASEPTARAATAAVSDPTPSGRVADGAGGA